MALPLVLSLTDLLLALAALVVGVSAWTGQRQRPEATRVMAAAERSALDLLAQAAPFGAAFLLLFGCSGAALQGPLRDLLLAAALGAAVAAAGAWVSGWQAAQTAARLSWGGGPDVTTIERGRLAIVSLLLGAAAGSGLTALCFAVFEAAPARAALMGATSAVGLLTILARPGVLSWAAAARFRRSGDLHPGSLAELAGTTFAGSWLLHVSLFALSALAEVALFVLSTDAAHGLGAYALLLPRLGLFAVLCAGLGARQSVRDGAQAGHVRQLAIALAVLAGGAWALRGVLQGDTARTWAPGLVCYLCAAFGFGAWLLGSKPRRPPTFTGALLLAPVLLLTLVVDPSALGGHRALLLLVIGTSVALLPLAAVYRIDASVLAATATCERLATGQNEPAFGDASARPAPSAGQQATFLPLALAVALSGGSVLAQSLGDDAANLLVAGSSALCALLLLHGLSRREQALGAEGGALLAALSEQRSEDGGLLLGEGLDLLKRVGGQRLLSFVAALLGPPLAVMVLAWFGSPRAPVLSAGALAGALFWAAIADEPATEDRPRAAHGAFVWPLALYYLCWAALLSTSAS